MRGHAMRAAVTLGAAVALAAPLTAASATAPTPGDPDPHRHRGGTTVLADCQGQSEVRPGSHLLACGDGNSRLVSLHWGRWDADTAVGRGVNQVNDCDPYCAAGTFRSYPVTVRLEAPTGGHGSGERHFTRISVTYTDGRPDGSPRTVSYPLG
ncbi:hypothetical protein [Streptomyces sp. CRN 30]|uniref:hypothetical protein n=1 Tax=Streptomyces sp. CRN 30 TaxID=3075613 RepID=UPI002A8015CD|nr:hypothetical protein [Streptomyces sp. CRN 30]